MGDAVVCPQGHKAGHLTKDVHADRPVRLYMLSLAGPTLFRPHAYGYCDCDEPVAFEVSTDEGA